ncbi:DUF1543 domain-containing protein [Acinetobacter sp. GXMZU3951]
MSHLFVVMLGGRHQRANTEVHDVVAVWGDSLEATFPQLRQAWFAEQKGLHIDAWMKINTVESEGQYYQIRLSNTAPQPDAPKLFLINLGGYDAQEFGELHRYVLIVANNAQQAKQRAKLHFAQQWQKPHTDRVLEVDDCIALAQVENQYIHLELATPQKNDWENTYLLLND